MALKQGGDWYNNATAAERADRFSGDKPMSRPGSDWWPMGSRVRKKSGSSWQGHIVGFYQTVLTPEGYAIESEREPGSVQIYPRAALERL